VNALASLYEKLVVDPSSQTVGIVHAGCRDDADQLASLINKNLPPREILLVDYEPVTGSHVGPGALALFFLSKKGVRSTDSL
jgi:fatty acid-binding protein DegV